MKIILLGLKGVGKTTVGIRLAQILGWPFFDTDEEISKMEGRSYKDVFQHDGENRFRELESKVLRELQNCGDSVISVGGGGFMLPENQKILSGLGRLICLHMSKESLLKRWEEWPIVCKSSSEFAAYYEKRVDMLTMLSCVWVDASGSDVARVIKRVCNV